MNKPNEPALDWTLEFKAGSKLAVSSEIAQGVSKALAGGEKIVMFRVPGMGARGYYEYVVPADNIAILRSDLHGGSPF